jgi:hypothetical protein
MPRRILARLILATIDRLAAAAAAAVVGVVVRARGGEQGTYRLPYFWSIANNSLAGDPAQPN